MEYIATQTDEEGNATQIVTDGLGASFNGAHDPGKEYTVTVEVRYVDNPHIISEPASVVTVIEQSEPLAPPSKPDRFRVYKLKPESIELRWFSSVGADGYDIEYDINMTHNTQQTTTGLSVVFEDDYTVGDKVAAEILARYADLPDFDPSVRSLLEIELPKKLNQPINPRVELRELDEWEQLEFGSKYEATVYFTAPTQPSNSYTVMYQCKVLDMEGNWVNSGASSSSGSSIHVQLDDFWYDPTQQYQVEIVANFSNTTIDDYWYADPIYTIIEPPE